VLPLSDYKREKESDMSLLSEYNATNIVGRGILIEQVCELLQDGRTIVLDDLVKVATACYRSQPSAERRRDFKRRFCEEVDRLDRVATSTLVPVAR
jgi:hypothetical protein